jgi:hypothetical protein
MEPASSSGGVDGPGGHDALARRLFQLAGILAVLLIAVVAFAWMHGDDETSLNPIAQAAIRTQQSSGGRSSFHGIVRGPSMPDPLRLSGDGMFNGQTNRSQVTMTIPTPAGGVEMEGVGSGTQMYFKSKLFEGGLPSGDEWVGIDASFGTSSETEIGANSDPSAQLDLLRAASDEFETLGKEKVRGVETTVYRSTFDFDSFADYLRGKGAAKAAEQYERLAEGAPSNSEFETWIDDRGLVRRMKIDQESHDPDSGDATTMEMTADFYDFGISPDIQLPDPGTVYDATPMVRSHLGLDG